jgi:predicted outer membrane repeat protein
LMRSPWYHSLLTYNAAEDLGGGIYTSGTATFWAVNILLYFLAKPMTEQATAGG